MIREHAKAGHSVEKMCAIYQVSRSGYYKWESGSESNRAMRARKRAELLEKIRAIFHEYRGRYGSARIHRELVLMESFFHALKKEQVRGIRLASRDEIKNPLSLVVEFFVH